MVAAHDAATAPPTLRQGSCGESLVRGWLLDLQLPLLFFEHP